MSEHHRLFPDGPPDDLLACSPAEAVALLGKPTLIRVPGASEQAPRVITCLLHGDESTGLEAALALLQREESYPFDLWVLIGNVRAAAEPPGFAHRFLNDQEDFNRVWGLGDPTTTQRLAADAMLDVLREAGPEAVVDIHNNTGENPFYAIVTSNRPQDLNLATLFTSTLLRWDLDANTMMEAFDRDTSAIGVECGLANRPESLAFVLDGLDRFLAAPGLATDRAERDFDLLGDLVKVTVRPEVRFSFGPMNGDGPDTGTDFVVAADADRMNFARVPARQVIGQVHPGATLPLRAHAPNGTDVTDRWFGVDGVDVITTKPTTPVMMTRTVAAARKDCLFYLSRELSAAS